MSKKNDIPSDKLPLPLESSPRSAHDFLQDDRQHPPEFWHQEGHGVKMKKLKKCKGSSEWLLQELSCHHDPGIIFIGIGHLFLATPKKHKPSLGRLGFPSCLPPTQPEIGEVRSTIVWMHPSQGILTGQTLRSVILNWWACKFRNSLLVAVGGSVSLVENQNIWTILGTTS